MCVPHASISLIILNKNVEKLPEDLLFLLRFHPNQVCDAISIPFPSVCLKMHLFSFLGESCVRSESRRKAVRSERKIINTLNCLIPWARRLRLKSGFLGKVFVFRSATRNVLMILLNGKLFFCLIQIHQNVMSQNIYYFHLDMIFYRIMTHLNPLITSRRNCSDLTC